LLTSRADAAPEPVAEAAVPAPVPVPVLDMDVVIVPDIVVVPDAVAFVAESVPPIPSVTDGVVLFDADAAAAMNFSIVLPVVAALMAPTIPDWQCFPCEQ